MWLFDLWEQLKINPQKAENMFNTETMLPISEIKNETVILKDGWLRAILKIEGINLDLKNFEEQQIVLEQYKRFLNGLQFPIQIIIRNNYLDLSNYLNYTEANIKKISNPTLKETWESYYKFLQDIDSKQGMIFDKVFYITIPYYPWDKNENEIKKSRFTKFLDVLNSKDSIEKIVERYRWFSKGKTMLDTRCNLVTEWLWALGIVADRLSTADTISILFNYYNPLLHNAQWKIDK